MAIIYKNVQIDPELERLLPPLSKDDYETLEQSLIKNGFNEQFGKIKVWYPNWRDERNNGYIVDGHNRYKICNKHNIGLSQQCFEIMLFDSREEVIKWMYENQLARRNLSAMDKYETVERYAAFLKDLAKKNQSDGGKGLSNLTSINVRKEKAKMAGVSDGNYYKLDKIKKSGNEEIIRQVREKKISIDKAYKKIRSPRPKEEDTSTPYQQIENIDKLIKEIDIKVKGLQTQKESLMLKREHLFETSGIEYELKYEFYISDRDFLGSGIVTRGCKFFIEIGTHRQVFLDCHVEDETPWSLWMNKIPEKYKNDFISLWKKAYFEQKEYFKRCADEHSKKTYEETYRTLGNNVFDKGNKDFYKRCFRILAKCFHPDSKDGNEEDMQNLNELKSIWGI